MTWPTRVLGDLADLYVRVLFVPVLASLVSFAYAASSDSCSDVLGGVAMVLLAVLLSFVAVGFAFLMANCRFDANVFSSSLLARPHARFDLLLVLTKAFLVYMYVLLQAGGTTSRYYLVVVTTALFLLCAYCHTRWLPAFDKTVMYAQVAEWWLLVWAAVAMIVTQARNNAAEESSILMFAFGIPVLFAASILYTQYMMQWLADLSVRDLGSVFDVELKLRFMLYRMLAKRDELSLLLEDATTNAARQAVLAGEATSIEVEQQRQHDDPFRLGLLYTRRALSAHPHFEMPDNAPDVSDDESDASYESDKSESAYSVSDTGEESTSRYGKHLPLPGEGDTTDLHMDSDAASVMSGVSRISHISGISAVSGLSNVSRVSQVTDTSWMDAAALLQEEAAAARERAPLLAKQSDAEQIDDYIANVRSLLGNVDTWFTRAARIYPDSALLYRFWAQVQLFLKRDGQLSAVNALTRAANRKPSIDTRFVIRRFRKHVGEMVNASEGVRTAMAYMQFNDHMRLARVHHKRAAKAKVDFWKEAAQLEPNIHMLHMIGSHYGLALHWAQVHYDKMLFIHENSALALRMYSSFLRYVADRPDDAIGFEERALQVERVAAAERAKQQQSDETSASLVLDLFAPENGVITISGQQSQVGHILDVDGSVPTIFGALTSELVGRNVSSLMPAPFDELHDFFILRYLQTGMSRLVGTTRMVFGLHQLGYIFPMHLWVEQLDAHTNASSFIGVMRPSSSYDEFLMLNSDGVVTYGTLGALGLFQIAAESEDRVKSQLDKVIRSSLRAYVEQQQMRGSSASISKGGLESLSARKAAKKLSMEKADHEVRDLYASVVSVQMNQLHMPASQLIPGFDERRTELESEHGAKVDLGKHGVARIFVFRMAVVDHIVDIVRIVSPSWAKTKRIGDSLASQSGRAPRCVLSVINHTLRYMDLASPDIEKPGAGADEEDAEDERRLAQAAKEEEEAARAAQAEQPAQQRAGKATPISKRRERVKAMIAKANADTSQDAESSRSTTEIVLGGAGDDSDGSGAAAAASPSKSSTKKRMSDSSSPQVRAIRIDGHGAPENAHSEVSRDSGASTSMRELRQMLWTAGTTTSAKNYNVYVFRYTLLATLLVVIMATVFALTCSYLVVDRYKESMDAVKQSGERALLCKELAHHAQTLLHYAQGAEVQSEAEYAATEMLLAARLLQDTQAALSFLQPDLLKAQEALLRFPDIEISETTTNGVRTRRNVNLLQAVEGFILHAQLLGSQAVDSVQTDDVHIFYLRTNFARHGDLPAALDLSASLFRQHANDLRQELQDFELHLAIATTVGLVLVALLLLRPSMRQLEDSKLSVLRMFEDIAPIEVRSLLTEARNDLESDPVTSSGHSSSAIDLTSITDDQNDKVDIPDEENQDATKIPATARHSGLIVLFLGLTCVAFIVSMFAFASRTLTWVQDTPTDVLWAGRRMHLQRSILSETERIAASSNATARREVIADLSSDVVQLREIDNGLLFDADAFGSAAQHYPSQNALLFGSLCSDNPHRAECRAFAHGVLELGMHTAHEEFVATAIRVVRSENANLSVAARQQNLADLERLREFERKFMSWGTLQSMLLYVRDANDRLTDFLSIRTGVSIAFCVALLLAYARVFSPLLDLLELISARGNKVLLLVPLRIMQTVPSIRDFVTHNLKRA